MWTIDMYRSARFWLSIGFATVIGFGTILGISSLLMGKTSSAVHAISFSLVALGSGMMLLTHLMGGEEDEDESR